MVNVVLHEDWTPIRRIPGLEYRFFGDTPWVDVYGVSRQRYSYGCHFEFRLGRYYGRVPVDPGYLFRGSSKEVFEVMDYIIDDFMMGYRFAFNVKTRLI